MDPGSLASARITWRSSTGIESELAPVGALEILRSRQVAPWRQFRSETIAQLRVPDRVGETQTLTLQVSRVPNRWLRDGLTR